MPQQISPSAPIVITENVASSVAPVTLAKGVSGRQVAQALVANLTSNPRLASLHLVYDLRPNAEGATDADVDVVARAYATIPRSPGRKFTCFITHDPHFHLWAASMDEKYSDRHHSVFEGIPEALAYLAQAGKDERL